MPEILGNWNPPSSFYGAALTLALFVFWVFANNPDLAETADYLAFHAHLFDR
jgi:exo-beta-1,3-glucanase (GH17 family)